MTYEPSRYWETTLSEGYDLAGVGYPYLPRSFNAALYRAMRRAAHRAVRDARLTPASVLDIGSGTGFWIDFWQSLGVERITSIDLTETAVAGLRSRFSGVAVAQADVTEGIGVEGPLDAVSAMSVLLHIVDDGLFRGALANLAGVLGPGGTAIVIDPVAVHAHRGPAVGPQSNSKARSLTEWHEAAEAAGLDIASIRSVTWLLAEPVDARSRIGFRLLDASWKLLSRIVYESESRGRLVGSAVGLVDDILVRLPGTGASTKCLVLRKR